MSSRAEGPDALEVNCETLGTLSQKITRSWMTRWIVRPIYWTRVLESQQIAKCCSVSQELGGWTKLASPEYLA